MKPRGEEVTDFLAALAPTRGHFIYLASQSPRRRELLRQIGVEFRVVEAQVDEARLPEETPEQMVTRLAREKAHSGLERVRSDSLDLAPVLGADTCVVLGGEILGKPANRTEGMEMLARLAGKRHQVLTGIAIAADAGVYDVVSRSTVDVAPLSPRDIQQYWDSGEAAGKAGAYGIQGLAGAFVHHIEGSYSGVVGLPLYEFVSLMNRARSAISE
jgi:septum formation protein